MTERTSITFNVDLNQKGMRLALDEVEHIAKDVPLFAMAAFTEDDASLSVDLLSRDRSTTVNITGQFLNLEVTDAISEITGDSLTSRSYNRRTYSYSTAHAPGGLISVSSKTKLSKIMKLLGADPAIAKEFRTATAGSILRITDHSDEETEPGVTRVEVFRKDDYVQASWDVAVKGVDLNVEVKATAKIAVLRSDLEYSISLEYSRAGQTAAFKHQLEEAGFRPFRGTIS